MVQEYSCTHCNKKFKRKWNALRHNDQIHHGLGIIHDIKSGWTSKNNEKLGGRKNPDPHDELTTDLYIINIMGKILKPLLELEKEVVEKIEPERSQFFARILAAALITSDPVKMIQDEVDFNRSLNGKMKIVSYFSKGMGISPLFAEQYINSLIKDSKYYKNYAKFAFNTGI